VKRIERIGRGTLWLVFVFTVSALTSCGGSDGNGGSGATSCGGADCTLAPEDGAPGNLFGDSVALDGGVVVVGAYGDDESGPEAGSAYVYRQDGDTWTQEQKLLASDGTARDQYGIVVAASGNVVVVGSHTGYIYIYRHDGTAWVEEQKIEVFAGLSGDYFNNWLDIDRDVIVAGASFEDQSTLRPESGAAHVYRFDGTTWLEEQFLFAGDGLVDDFYGSAVAIDGDVIVIGAPGDDRTTNEVNTGSAYVYRYGGATWNFEQKLVPVTPIPVIDVDQPIPDISEIDPAKVRSGDRFGTSVAVDGEVIVVGADSVDKYEYEYEFVYVEEDLGEGPVDVLDEVIIIELGVDLSNTGAAVVYERNGSGTWIEGAKLTSPHRTEKEYFGRAAAVEGGLIVIGSNGVDERGDVTGLAYTYRADGDDWQSDQTLVAPAARAHDNFGNAVAMDEGTAIIGAFGRDVRGVDSGAAYLFEF